MPMPRDPSAPRPVPLVVIDRAIRQLGVTDRNRFGRVDARMSPDRLALPAPIALLLRK